MKNQVRLSGSQALGALFVFVGLMGLLGRC